MAIIIYFSHGGETIINGQKVVREKGNTAILAENIAAKIDAEIYSLKPSQPYPENYDALVEQVCHKKELTTDFIDLSINVDDDEFFIGYPNWCGTMPEILQHFLASQDFSGKNIYPFCTHEGSALGSSLVDLKNLCPTAIIKTGLAVRGSKVEKSQTAIDNWLMQYQCDTCHKKQLKKGSL
ncbi:MULTISPECIES: flavodoxin [Enterococcus]|uniref:Flavodoxin-like domain-containing protein n=1 Tax=Enterococcus alishanensis TaxID=1303817 RepID=A0ABS6TDK6_9ENTE|nr:flavodoxin [Enterococcus alishanensis]MBV7390981.1 hypothetical protein [Enterococcus alishanensis]